MNEARPYASLSSGLLARKGSAKPAMRPQGFTGFEDLGWNDMGFSQSDEPAAPAAEHVPSSIAALTPSPRAVRPDSEEEALEPAAEEQIEAVEPEADSEIAAPAVVVQQRTIQQRFDADELPEAPAQPAARNEAKVVSLPRRSAIAAGRKAAFTLRLDAERHVRLRLACAVAGRSAQQIVTAALDEALAAMPEIEALASRLPATGAKRN